MSHKYVAIVLGIFAVLTLSTSAATVFGQAGSVPLIQKSLASIFTADVRSSAIAECEQSATTTDCAIKPATTESQVQNESPAQVRTYGALSRTYVNSSQDFTLAYPNEMSIESAGDIILHDTRNARNFALKICSRGTPCATDYERVGDAGVQDFKVERIVPYGSSAEYGKLMYKYSPQETETYSTSRGYVVLKLLESHIVINESGHDVTRDVCEECGTARKYVLFGPSGDYVVFWLVAGQSEIAEKIIDSVRF